MCSWIWLLYSLWIEFYLLLSVVQQLLHIKDHKTSWLRDMKTKGLPHVLHPSTLFSLSLSGVHVWSGDDPSYHSMKGAYTVDTSPIWWRDNTERQTTVTLTVSPKANLESLIHLTPPIYTIFLYTWKSDHSLNLDEKVTGNCQINVINEWTWTPVKPS